MKRRAFIAFIAAIVALSSVAPVAAAAIAYDASAAPAAHVATDVTVSAHDRADMTPLQYEGDGGELQTLPATINSSSDVDDLGNGHVNEFSFTPTDVAFKDASAFPINKDDVSAVDNESEWSTTVSDTTNTALTVSDVTTAPGVEAVEIATGGSMGSGDTATATFSNFSVTSDINKRYLQLGLTVDTLDSGATVDVRAVDSDGDYVVAEINTSRSSGEDFITNATGDGIIYQRQVGKMSVVQNGGDGSLGEIQKIEVVVQDADANVDVMALNVQKMSKWTLGVEKTNTDTSDGDSDLEENTIYEHKTGGDISIHDLSTMGSTFDSAVIHDLTFPANFRLADLPDSDTQTSFSAADSYPAFEHKFEYHAKLKLPTAYDLSYANAELQDTVSVPSGRYETVEVAEGVGDTEFADISSWSSVKSSYSSEGADVTLDSTIQPGQQIAVHYVYPVTADEKSALEAVGGAVGGPIGGSGGLGDLPVVGGVFAALGSLWAWVTGRIPGLN